MIDNKNYKRASLFYKINSSLIIFLIIVSVVLRPLLEDYSTLLDTLVGLPMILMIITIPIGLYYSWICYKNKIGQSKKRFRFFIVHLLLMIIIVGFILVITKDFSNITK